MTRELIACRPTDDVSRAEALMARHQKSRVLVTDEHGKLLGVISLSDLAGTGEPLAAETLRAVCPREILEPHGRRAQ
jgi:CBS-domain-containing membrane protein